MSYVTVVIGGKVRLSRPSSVVSPLPARQVTRVSRYARVARDVERTQAKPSPRIWAPGMVLTRVVGLIP